MPSPTPVTASPTQPFQYHARVTAAYDGDTCTADIDFLASGGRGADEVKVKARVTA